MKCCCWILISLLFVIDKAILAKRPNVLIILTDDQDVVLDGMHPMRNVKNLIGSAGATFENAVSHVKILHFHFQITYIFSSIPPHRCAVPQEPAY